jgi:hypothetical protein
MNAPNELPNRGLLKLAAASLFFLVAALPVDAQQINGVPGSPSATTTIPGNQLPAPPEPFGGVIKETAKDSTPYWPATIVPPKGAPNVLLIMTDDQGYGVSGTFGGVIPTPAMDRVATAGLRYTQFHSTALHACRDHYGPQPSLSRLWCDRRNVHWLPWLRFGDRQG